MTDKLPVVGQKYRIKNSKMPWDICEIIDIETKGDTDFVNIEYKERFFKQASYEAKIFNECFEEVPEDKTETKLETQNNHFPDVGKMVLSPEVKDAMEGLKMIVSGSAKFIDMDDVKYSCQNLLNALDKQFMSKEEVKIDIKQEYVDSVKVNETSKSVAVKEEEDKKKEEEFFSAFIGKLIEYQGKRYVCISQTQYLPNERPDGWKECDYSLPEYIHTKIKFRDIFANNKTQAKEVADNEIEAYRLGTSNKELRILKEYEERFGKFHPAQDLKSCIKIALKWHASAVDNKIQPDENGSFKHLDNAEELSQEIMKKSAEESIWKPDCETMEERSKGCLTGKTIILHPYEPKYIQIFSLINDYEKLKERVRKLEGK